jgi:hypothetical protein
MFNISNFFAQQKLFGIARANYFEVYLGGVGLVDDLVAKTFSRIYCKAASIPSMNLNYVEVPFRGLLVTLPTTRFYDEWQVTVTNDTNFVLRTRLEKWVEEINGKFGVPERTGLNIANILSIGNNNEQGVADFGRLLKDVWIVQYANDRFIRPTATYFLRDAFPTTVTSAEVGWDNNDATQDYTVSFRYQYLERKSLNELPSEILNQIRNLG